jgi:hypothetical protein
MCSPAAGEARPFITPALGPQEGRSLGQILAPNPVGKSYQPPNNLTFVYAEILAFSGCGRNCPELWPAQVKVSHIPRQHRRDLGETVIWFIDKLRHGSKDSPAPEFRRVSKV